MRQSSLQYGTQNLPELLGVLNLDKPWKWLKAYLDKAKYLPVESDTALELLLAKSFFSESELRAEAGVSIGKTCRILPGVDGNLAVNLARQSDYELLPAWLGIQGLDRCMGENEIWQQVGKSIKNHLEKELYDLAGELGMAVSIAKTGLTPDPSSVLAEDLKCEPNSSQQNLKGIKVIDISALWAGPLVGKLLAESGAEVIKLESKNRPDGLKEGSPKFYEYLNGQKTYKCLEFKSETGKAKLKEYFGSAAVVIENSRSRAMEQLGIDPSEFVSKGTIWVSITGYGRSSNRVAFGDDAAVAGGLFLAGEHPEFIGDAIADPITGVDAYISTMDCLAKQEPALLDISMVESVKKLLGS